MRLIISNLFQIARVINVGVNPLRIYKPGLVKYCVGEVTVFKCTAYKSCCPENSLL